MRQKLMKFKLRIIVVFSLICLGSVTYGLTQSATSVTGENFVILVKPGMAATDIGDLLYKQGAIKSIFLFRIVAKAQGMENSLQPGEYVFSKKMTVQQMVAMLAKGENFYKDITIPEGYTVEQIANLLQERQLGSASLFKTAAQNFVPYTYMSMIILM